MTTTPLVKTTAGAGAGATASTKLDKAHSDLKKASQQFESYFINQMLKEMRKTVSTDDDVMGGSSNEQQIFQDMTDQAMADSMSKQGSFGIASMLYNELSKGLPPNNPGPATSTSAPSDAGVTTASTASTATTATVASTAYRASKSGVK